VTQVLTFSNRRAGVVARFAASAITGYFFQIGGNGDTELKKVVAGTQTSLQTGSITLSLPETVKCEANGSSVTAYRGGASHLTTTDTAITGNTRCGLTARYFIGQAALDNFEAADLDAGGQPMRKRWGGIPNTAIGQAGVW
jgi:hypothetical protein